MTQNNQTHEKLSAGTEVKAGPDRAFGLTFAAILFLVAFAPLLKGRGMRWWAVGVAIAFLAAAFMAPKLLSPLNRIWFRFGLMLHKIVSPVVLGLMFFIVLTPFALLLRILGKHPLMLDLDRAKSTYWTVRAPPGPLPRSMTQQF